MKNNLIPLAVAITGLFGLPAIGHAQATDGAFINGNVGTVSVHQGSLDSDDISYGGNVGYRWAISPDTLIGIEGGYVDLGKFSYPASVTYLAPIDAPPTEPLTLFGRGRTEWSGWTIGVNGRFNLSSKWYIGGRVGFLRAGVSERIRINRPDSSVLRLDDDYNANGWYAGTGLGYDFSKSFSLGLNYDYYNAKKSGSKINPDVISASGEYRF